MWNNMTLKYYLNKEIEQIIIEKPGIKKDKVILMSKSSIINVDKSIDYLSDKGVIYKDIKTNGFFHS